MLMADEILANLGRLRVEDHWNGDVMVCQCQCGALWGMRARLSDDVSVIKFALYGYSDPCPLLPLQQSK